MKIVVNCKTRKAEKRELTEEELTQRVIDNQHQVEQEMLKELGPTEEEVDIAKIQLVTINTLMEVGLL